jgi:hypothetical protein
MRAPAVMATGLNRVYPLARNLGPFSISFLEIRCAIS